MKQWFHFVVVYYKIGDDRNNVQRSNRRVSASNEHNARRDCINQFLDRGFFCREIKLDTSAV